MAYTWQRIAGEVRRNLNRGHARGRRPRGHTGGGLAMIIREVRRAMHRPARGHHSFRTRAYRTRPHRVRTYGGGRGH
jgi:hypothetical protein